MPSTLVLKTNVPTKDEAKLLRKKVESLGFTVWQETLKTRDSFGTGAEVFSCECLLIMGRHDTPDGAEDELKLVLNQDTVSRKGNNDKFRTRS